MPSVGGRPNWVVTNTLANQLEQLDIKPSAIRYVGLANSHIDHIGNLAMFSGATILIQRSEWDFAQTRRFEGMLDEARLRTDLPVAKIEGDYDVFGDGTVQIIATPSVVTGAVNPRIDGEAGAGEDKGAVEAPGLFNGIAIQSDGLSVVSSV